MYILNKRKQTRNQIRMRFRFQKVEIVSAEKHFILTDSSETC